MGVVYITRFSTIQAMRGYKVYECATKYMRLRDKKLVSFCVAPPTHGRAMQV